MSIEDVDFEDIISKLVIVKEENGLKYYESFSIGDFNVVKTLRDLGYVLFVNDCSIIDSEEKLKEIFGEPQY